MRKIKFNLLVVALMTVCVSAYAAGIQDYYTGKDTSSDKNFLVNIEIQWLLTKVSIDGIDTGFNRSELSGFNNRDEIFSLNFGNTTTLGSNGNLSGVGAPNRFSGPYMVGDKQVLIIMPMRSTLMASLFEPENLMEHDYFNYLQNAYKWDRIDNVLIIYSNNDGNEVIMTFISSD